jgi:TPR repeat protein
MTTPLRCGALTPEGAFLLGMRYRKGEGVPQDHGQAAFYFRHAADLGLALAQFHTAVSYDKGEGVPQNHSEAARYYRLAADQGIAPAQHSIATFALATLYCA